ncbi:hypothetical protein CCACVL1_28861 [Corchorus capsularis]|uniref:Ninja-family protein n=1 Tax=Corchorus capsularis TaxID=210143 RepID=A0A1R3G4X0_COCAP|nr:hypothetical protein CCACVL1_28861 [Corchorus capsularis]
MVQVQHKFEFDQANFPFQDHKQHPMSNYFLQNFSSGQTNLKQTTQFSDPRKRPPDALDLNLRLSLGGIYNNGMYPKEKPLTRSSSIAGVVTLNKNCSDFEKPLPKSFLSLARSCSLPAEVEKSKRVVNVNVNVNVKELRIMRRVEAKKRVVEKQRNAQIANEIMEGPPSSPSKIPAWAAASAAKSPAFNRAIDKIKEGFRKMEGLEVSGTTKVSSESKSPSKPIKAEPEFTFETTLNEKSVKLKPAETMSENPTKKAKLSNNDCIQHDGIDVMKKMPSVTTTGDGPNGRKIEGFLYKYLKGQVSIVCVCHGSFLSPEEFVKHAGRKDVTNPMKHINVCSTSFSY